MKNNQIIIAVVIVILLLIGAGAMFMNKKSSPSPTEIPSGGSQTQPSQNAVTEAKNSLMGLMSTGKSLECTFSLDNQSTGTMYISDSKVRGNFSTMMEGKKNEMSMIREGDYSYVWGPALPQGFKIKMAVDENGKTTSNDATKQYFDLNQQANYQCKPWNADNSFFTPPSNITFQDMSELMEKVQDNTGNAQCSACANLEGEAQSVCKQQFNCN